MEIPVSLESVNNRSYVEWIKYMHQTKKDQSCKLLYLISSIPAQIQHRKRNAKEACTGENINAASDIVEHDSRIDAFPRRLRQPTLVDRNAGKHAYERGGGEEGYDNDHEKVVDRAGNFDQGKVEAAVHEIAIDKRQRELAEQ